MSPVHLCYILYRRSRLGEQDFIIHSREKAPAKLSVGAAKTVVKLTALYSKSWQQVNLVQSV